MFTGIGDMLAYKKVSKSFKRQTSYRVFPLPANNEECKATDLRCSMSCSNDICIYIYIIHISKTRTKIKTFQTYKN
jgi:hypothetical protein